MPLSECEPEKTFRQIKTTNLGDFMTGETIKRTNPYRSYYARRNQFSCRSTGRNKFFMQSGAFKTTHPPTRQSHHDSQNENGPAAPTDDITQTGQFQSDKSIDADGKQNLVTLPGEVNQSIYADRNIMRGKKFLKTTCGIENILKRRNRSLSPVNKELN